MITYSEATEFLFSQVPMFQNVGAGAYKPGLDTTLTLARRWGDPHRAIPAMIHVAGTNGKGSTAHTIAAILQAAGYRTGLYTSPHLVDFRERIRVDGRPIPQDDVCRFVDTYMADSELRALAPTFFELTTVMAFRHFADAAVDVAVIETGLGGRLDCTNIITPILSIITNISLDHTALLGNTHAAIAAEKAGIIKPGVPVVIGRADSDDVRDVFDSAARRAGAPIVYAADTVRLDIGHDADGAPFYRGTPWGDIHPALTGDCQPENAATVMAALDVLCQRLPRINSEAVCRGFADVCRTTGLMGRWMWLGGVPVRTVCDTGHNIGGWEWLAPALCRMADSPAGRLHIILGFVADKDIAHILPLLPRNATYRFATPSVARGRSAESLAAEAAAAGIEGSVFATVADAYADALAAADASADTIFVGGSTFVVADLLAEYQKQ